MIRTEAMKLLAFKFQEEKCVVLGEDDQVARGAPPPAPGGRREPTCRRQGGGGRPQAESLPGRFSTGAAGPPEILSCQAAHQPGFQVSPCPTPLLCIVTDRLVISPNTHEKPRNP